MLVWLGDPVDAPAHPRTIQRHAQGGSAGPLHPTEGAIAVSSVTGEGLSELLRISWNVSRGRCFPPEDAIALNRRQAELICEEAADALARACTTSMTSF